jgi:hypothetical protein
MANYGYTSGIGDVNYNAPTLGDTWMNAISGQANAMNAGGGRGGGGGGGTTNATLPGGWIQKSQEFMYDNPELNLQKAQLALKQQHWNQIFGMLGNFAGQNPYVIGGGVGKPPEVSVGGVWNPQQIQQQVNASRAATDQATVAQQQASAQSATGRGFSPTSPMINAMQGQEWAAGLGTKAASEQKIRQDAAQANASQLLNTQQARANEWANQQQLEIQRAAPYFTRQNAWLAALAGMA